MRFLLALKRVLYGRFFKYAVVGILGILVNLAVIALLVRYYSLRDWRASAIANCLSNFHNFILNNVWTFSDRRRKGFRFVTGYLSYLSMSAAGLAATTGIYAGLVWTAGYYAQLRGVTTGSLIPLICQFVAIVPGVSFNFHLNKMFTWRKSAPKWAHEQTSCLTLFPVAGSQNIE